MDDLKWKKTKLSNLSLFKWGKKGSISIIDQVIYSGANFILIVLLARWLEPKTFGAFSVSFAFFSIFYHLHNGFISEPMNVLGFVAYSVNQGAYLKVQAKIHFLFTFGIGIIFIFVSLISGLFLRPFSYNNLNVYLGLLIPFILLPWFVRRAYYFLHKPLGAALTSLVYCVFLFSLLVIFRSAILQRTETVYVIMAIAGFVASLSIIYSVRGGECYRAEKLKEIVKQNWNFGKWIIMTGVLLSLAHQMQILVMGNIRSLEDAGIFRALDNFIQPMVVIMTAISTLFLPVFSAQFRKPGAANFKKNGALITCVVFLLSIIYGLFLLVFRFQLENLFFGGTYVDYLYLIPLFSLVPILMSLTIGASVILKAIQKPQALFIVAVGSVVTSAVTSFVFIPIWGIAGAVWSAVITQAVSTILIFVLFTQRFIKQDFNRISD